MRDWMSACARSFKFRTPTGQSLLAKERTNALINRRKLLRDILRKCGGSAFEKRFKICRLRVELSRRIARSSCSANCQCFDYRT
jgi:hypothetical protein